MTYEQQYADFCERFSYDVDNPYAEYMFDQWLTHEDTQEEDQS